MTERIDSENDTLSTRLIGDSRLVVVNKHLRYRTGSVEFPNGHRGEYTYIDDEHAAVGIAALDRRMGQRSLFMIFQERYPSQTAGWEIPAGGSDGDELAAAKNELEEEGGLKAFCNQDSRHAPRHQDPREALLSLDLLGYLD